MIDSYNLLKPCIGGRRNLAFVSSMKDTDDELELTVDTSTIHVVDEFPDIFPNELLGLPSVHEI